jgi:hypothetical protein
MVVARGQPQERKQRKGNKPQRAASALSLTFRRPQAILGRNLGGSSKEGVTLRA